MNICARLLRRFSGSVTFLTANAAVVLSLWALPAVRPMPAPREVMALNGVEAIAAGYGYSLALVPAAPPKRVAHGAA